jgi:hypothetical protein
MEVEEIGQEICKIHSHAVGSLKLMNSSVIGRHLPRHLTRDLTPSGSTRCLPNAKTQTKGVYRYIVTVIEFYIRTGSQVALFHK